MSATFVVEESLKNVWSDCRGCGRAETQQEVLTNIVLRQGQLCMMIGTRLLCAGGSSVTRTFLSSCSFHSALKKQLKADKKAKEKEAKQVSEADAAAETVS